MKNEEQEVEKEVDVLEEMEKKFAEEMSKDVGFQKLLKQQEKKQSSKTTTIKVYEEDWKFVLNEKSLGEKNEDVTSRLFEELRVFRNKI